jgi:hypothetical protein
MRFVGASVNNGGGGKGAAYQEKRVSDLHRICKYAPTDNSTISNHNYAGARQSDSIFACKSFF